MDAVVIQRLGVVCADVRRVRSSSSIRLARDARRILVIHEGKVFDGFARRVGATVTNRLARVLLGRPAAASRTLTLAVGAAIGGLAVELGRCAVGVHAAALPKTEVPNGSRK